VGCERTARPGGYMISCRVVSMSMKMRSPIRADQTATGGDSLHQSRCGLVRIVKAGLGPARRDRGTCSRVETPPSQSPGALELANATSFPPYLDQTSSYLLRP
jgi:hypothetical protein